jgi:hypothetical protein
MNGGHPGLLQKEKEAKKQPSPLNHKSVRFRARLPKSFIPEENPEEMGSQKLQA